MTPLCGTSWLAQSIAGSQPNDYGNSKSWLCRPGRHDACDVDLTTTIVAADGALKRFGADYGIGVTGIAGPGGGTEEKPVGLVCFCVAQ